MISFIILVYLEIVLLDLKLKKLYHNWC